MKGHLHQLFIGVHLFEQRGGRSQCGALPLGQHAAQPLHRLIEINRSQQVVKAAIRGGEIEQRPIRQPLGVEAADMGFEGLAIGQQGITPRQAALLIVEGDGAELLDPDMRRSDPAHPLSPLKRAGLLTPDDSITQ